MTKWHIVPIGALFAACGGDCPAWRLDGDGDGVGGGDSVLSCEAPEGAVADSGAVDCDDGDASVYPGAPEDDCDGVDSDCGGEEEGAPVAWYADADGDGEGDPGAPSAFCADPGEGWVEGDGDCDDGDAAVHPGAEEVCGGDRDEDCDGVACALAGSRDVAAYLAAGGGAAWEGAAAAVGLGDLDGDGRDEIAVGFASDAEVWVVAGDGQVTTLAGQARFGAALAAGDLDGDGGLDLAVGAPGDGDGSVRWFAGGTGAETTLAPESWGSDFGAGLAVVAGGALAVMVYEGGSTPGYRVSTYAPAYTDVNLGPFNGSEAWPVALAAPRSGAGVAVGSVTPRSSKFGAVAYTSPTADDTTLCTLEGTGTNPTALGAAVALGDLDGDGALDLLVGAPDGDVAYAALACADSATLTPDDATHAWTGAGAGAALGLVGDLDGDGHDDLALGGDGTAWILTGPLSALEGGDLDDLATAVLTGLAGHVTLLAPAGDVNGDGYADLLLRDDDGVTLLYGGPRPASRSTP